jgi:hypothetical protein
MRTIEQAEKECSLAWAAQPDATHGWCVHHEQQWEALTEPIANRIKYIISSKARDEQVCRLDNMRPVSSASLAVVLPALKAYGEATEPARKDYKEATALALKAYEEATEPERKDYKEATALALKDYKEATAPALKAYEEAKATAHRQDVPSNTWNGTSIFKK